MIFHLFENTETRRILIYLGAAGTLAIVGGGIYAASISAVTPTNQRVAQEVVVPTSTAVVTQPIAPTPRVHLKGESIRVTIADTIETRAKGLSGRTSLARDEGMLFVFDTDGQYGFWMKDMLMAIDILWLDQSGKIIYIVQSAMPESYPEAYVPRSPARYVLELQADWVRTHGVSLGDRVEL